jgi:hypothetical protein
MTRLASLARSMELGRIGTRWFAELRAVFGGQTVLQVLSRVFSSIGHCARIEDLRLKPPRTLINPLFLKAPTNRIK